MQLILVGESGVGKTSLILRYVDDNFALQHLTSIGVDYKTKYVTVNAKGFEKTAKLQLWDTGTHAHPMHTHIHHIHTHTHVHTNHAHTADTHTLQMHTHHATRTHLFAAGQERFRAMTRNYYRNANGILLCFDLTDMNSFSHLRGMSPNMNLFSSCSSLFSSLACFLLPFHFCYFSFSFLFLLLFFPDSILCCFVVFIPFFSLVILQHGWRM